MASLKKSDFTKPILLDTPPEGLMKDPRLTFDEFLPYHASIEIKRVESEDNVYRKDSILEAAKSMRASKKRHKSYSYMFSLAADVDLDGAFNLPTDIEELDLFARYWPVKRSSKYLKERSKLFHGYHEGYKSAPHSVYGGMSEWLQLISGTIKLTLVRPTELNLAKYAAWEPSESFNPEEGTTITYVLRSGSFVVIPAGWLTIRQAESDSFAIGGEFLHHNDLSLQIECFKNDTINSHGQYAMRDTEIRLLYWISAARLLAENDRTILNTIDSNNLTSLKLALEGWKAVGKLDPVYLSQYIPSGLKLNYITRDLSRHIGDKTRVRVIRSRKSLKSPEHPVNILTDQASTDNRMN